MPIVVSGTKTVRKTVGRVADFCPICRDVKAFDLVHIGRAAHVYGVALGDGDTLNYEVRCLTCDVHFTSHARNYRQVSTNPQDSDDDVVSTCGRSRPEQLQKDLDETEKLRAGTLSVEERKTMMDATFEFLNEHARHRKLQVGAQEKDNGGCITSLMIFCSAFLIWHGWNRLEPGREIDLTAGTLYIFLPLIVSGIVYTLWQISGDTKRYIHSNLLPKLGCALKPFSPTADEIRELLKRYRKRKFTLARNLTEADIERALHEDVPDRDL